MSLYLLLNSEPVILAGHACYIKASSAESIEGRLNPLRSERRLNMNKAPVHIHGISYKSLRIAQIRKNYTHFTIWSLLRAI